MQSSSKSAISSSSLSDTFAVPDNSRKRAANATQALAGLKESIRQLKAIMLSLEWEMSMETLQQLDAEIAAQQEKWQDDKSVTALLRILSALGKYIGRIQARTHPLAIKLFFAVYNGMEKIVLSPAMSKAKKKKIVLLAFQRYNEVREKLILRQKLIAQGNKEAGAQQPPGEDLNKSAGELAEIPALGDIDFSAEEEKKRKIWLEDNESKELSTRLSSFFDDDAAEDKSSAALETGNESPSLPEKNKGQQDEGITTHANAQEEAEISPPDKKRKGVIDDLFSSNEDSPADQLLADMHLAVFTSDREISAPVSTQDPQRDDADTADKSRLESQVTEKLEAFFNDESGEEAVAAEMGQDAEIAPSEEGDRENISEEAFGGELQEKLNSFFDEEGEGEVHNNAAVVPMQSNAASGGSKSADILQELVKEIRLQSDGYKHLPEAEERGLLSNLFERVEKAHQDNPEILIPLCLLNASLFLFEGSKEATCKEALACAADLARMIQPPSEGEGVEKKDFAEIVAPQKKFLAVIQSNLPDSQARPDLNKPDHDRSESGKDRPIVEKKSRSKSQPKAKGDLIMEDLFSDE